MFAPPVRRTTAQRSLILRYDGPVIGSVGPRRFVFAIGVAAGCNGSGEPGAQTTEATTSGTSGESGMSDTAPESGTGTTDGSEGGSDGTGDPVPDGCVPQCGTVCLETDPMALALEDVDDNGWLDIVVLSAFDHASAMIVFPAEPAGVYGDSLTTYHEPAPPAGQRAMLAADFDGDGDVDLAHGTPGDIVVRRGDGSGVFDEILGRMDEDTEGPLLPLVRDEDGVPTRVVTGGHRADRPCCLEVFENDPDTGTFTHRQSLFGEPNAGRSRYWFDVADIDGDGTLDLAVITQGENGREYLEVFTPSAEGPLELVASSWVSHPYEAGSIADVDGDGRVDVVVAGPMPALIVTLRGNGDGSFSEDVAIPLFEPAAEVHTPDVDGDGTADLVSLHGDHIEVRRGIGDGTFLPSRTIPTGPGTELAKVADLDDDGRPDLVVASPATGALSVWFGEGDGDFVRGCDAVGHRASRHAVRR